jgi:Raf kinase inhibitor-like YbhB/YbcL family protein
MELKITSPLFEEGATIPPIITCEGDDISPQLDVDGLPVETVSMVVIMEDPDAPVGVWDHWVAFDIQPTDSIPQDVGDLGTLGINSWGDARYGGPCPPPGGGPHRYFTTIYALDIELGLDPASSKEAVLEALADSILAQGSLMGTFER